MSLVKEFVNTVRQMNAQKSTGPKTPEGRQRTRINALRHNLSGQHLVLQESEVEAYNRTAAKMFEDLKPKTEPERQIAQKIIDTNFRLNRMAAIETNMLTFSTVDNEYGNSDNEDRIEVMGAQTRAFVKQAPVFDLISRYEARLSRQLLKYQAEIERLQAVRKRQESADEWRSDEQIQEDAFDPASFGQHLKIAPDNYRLLSYLPPPKGWVKPAEDGPNPAEGLPTVADPPETEGTDTRMEEEATEKQAA